MGVEDQVTYEWCDSPPAFASTGSAAHMMSGEASCLSDPVFLPLPPSEPPLTSAMLSSAPMVPPPPPFCPAPCIDASITVEAPSLPPSQPPGDVVLSAEPAAPTNDATVLEISR